MSETAALAALGELAPALASVKLGDGQVLLVTLPDRHISSELAGRIRQIFVDAFQAAGAEIAEGRIIIAPQGVTLTAIDARA